MVKKILPYNGQQWNVSKKDGENAIEKRLNWKFKALIGVILVLIVLVVVLVTLFIGILPLPNNIIYWLPSYISRSKLRVYSSAAVSTDAAPCAPIGREILQKNGSAVDAAIAVLLCMGAVNPQSMGLGGGFLMIVYKRDTGKAYFFDAREKAPLKAFENMYNGDTMLSKKGPLAIAVPGELAGYEAAHRLFGTLPWEDLFQPTIELCKKGIPVSSHLEQKLKLYSKKFKQEPAWHFFFNNKTGEAYREGDKVFRPDLAETLVTMARDGAKSLYDPNHPLAKKFLGDLTNMGSIITAEDMAKYQVVNETLPPLIQLQDNTTIFGVPPPGSGPLLGLMMNILDGYNITKDVAYSKNQSVLLLHRVIEAFKFTYARRMELEDNTDTMPRWAAELSSKAYATDIRAKIDDRRTYQDPQHYGLWNATFVEDHGTASMSVIAPNGDAVSVTSTVNSYFGSTEISESTGIVLNNEMDDFSVPEVVSDFDVPPSVFNRIRPEKRPASSMCPTIAIDSNGDVKLVIGGNGGTKITTSVLQVTLRNLWLGEDIKESIDAPRFHHQLLPDNIEFEPMFPQDMIEELIKLGHVVTDRKGVMSGIVLAISRAADGTLQANSDYRKGGEVDGF